MDRAVARAAARLDLERYRISSPNSRCCSETTGRSKTSVLHLSVAVPVEGEAPEYVEVFGIEVLCAGRQLAGSTCIPTTARLGSGATIGRLRPSRLHSCRRSSGVSSVNFGASSSPRRATGALRDARAKSRKQFKPIPPAGLEPTPERIEAAGRIVEKQRQALAGLSTGRQCRPRAWRLLSRRDRLASRRSRDRPATS